MQTGVTKLFGQIHTQTLGLVNDRSGKSRKQRRTLKQLHPELRALGYEGSYDRVAAFARRWKVDQLERVNSASKSTTSPCVVALSIRPATQPPDFRFDTCAQAQPIFPGFLTCEAKILEAAHLPRGIGTAFLEAMCDFDTSFQNSGFRDWSDRIRARRAVVDLSVRWFHITGKEPPCSI